jgi:hypothetical protein
LAPKPVLFRFVAQAKKLAEKLNGSKPGESKTHFSDEFVINDYPQKARWKITHRETIVREADWPM